MFVGENWGGGRVGGAGLHSAEDERPNAGVGAAVHSGAHRPIRHQCLRNESRTPLAINGRDGEPES